MISRAHNDNAPIVIPTIPCSELAAYRAANQIFGRSSSTAEDLEAGFISRPASKGDLTLRIVTALIVLAVMWMALGVVSDWNYGQELAARV